MRVPPTGETTLVRTPDGRRLGVCTWGDPDGAPLFVLHGAPGSRFLRHPETGYRDRQLHVVTYDRPGYGVSTTLPGRTVADAATDVQTIADALGLDRFGVAGISSGGPCALAVAALLPGRVTRCATVVSGAPFVAEDLDFFEGMGEEHRAGWQAAAEAGDALDADCAETSRWAKAFGATTPDDADPDAVMLRDTLREAFRQGDLGYRADRWSEVRAWGFAVDEVRVPTRVMVAAEDDSVPVGHQRWLLRHLPDAQLVRVPGGHFGPRDAPEMDLMVWTGWGDRAPGT